jgi:hypothetical protein
MENMMTKTNWIRLARQTDLATHGDVIVVDLARAAERRRQKVHVDEISDSELRLWSRVAPAWRAEALGDGDPDLWTWKMNHDADFVGFRMDERGRLIGEIHVPMAGLDAGEFEFLVRKIARICDRWEFKLTGEDRM